MPSKNFHSSAWQALPIQYTCRFLFETILAHRSSVRHSYQKLWNRIAHLLIYYIYHIFYMKDLPAYPNAHARVKRLIIHVWSQENGSSIASFEIIFGALQFELFNSKLHSLRSKIRQIPGFNLLMYHGFLVHPPSVSLMTYSKRLTVIL